MDKLIDLDHPEMLMQVAYGSMESAQTIACGARQSKPLKNTEEWPRVKICQLDKTSETCCKEPAEPPNKRVSQGTWFVSGLDVHT